MFGKRLLKRRIKKLINAIAPPPEKLHSSFRNEISYDDMNISFYGKMDESMPKPVIPPPQTDDTGLN